MGTIIFLHLTRKNFDAALAFSLQSLVIAIIFFNSFLETGNIYLGIMVLLTIVVKVVLAPRYFIKLIQKHKLTFSVTTHLNTPLTLIIIAILTFVAQFSDVRPFDRYFPGQSSDIVAGIVLDVPFHLSSDKPERGIVANYRRPFPGEQRRRIYYFCRVGTIAIASNRRHIQYFYLDRYRHRIRIDDLQTFRVA